MTVRIGINGLGVMGRYLIRVLEDRIDEGELYDDEVAIVAFNDLYPAKQLAPLLAHDSIYLGFPGEVRADGKDILVNGIKIKGCSKKNPSDLHWEDEGVDIIYEATGAWVKTPKDPESQEMLERYLRGKAGAKKILFSAPTDLAEVTIVHGVNNHMYKGQCLVSAASCTTNCLAPLALALYKSFGEYTGLLNTVHAYTADQRLQDAPHKRVERGYAAALNIVPTSTGAAKAIGKVIPALDGKLDGIATRVPVPVGSVVDLTVALKEEVAREDVNRAVKRMTDTDLSEVIEYEEGPLVSSMVLGDYYPCIFDASQTRAIDNVAKVLAFYDNVAGFSNQALNLILKMGKSLETT